MVGWRISCKDNYDIKCAAEKSALHRELLSFTSNNEINNWPFPLSESNMNKSTENNMQHTLTQSHINTSENK